MPITVDVYDAAGNRLGQPITTAKSATIRRALNGPGNIRLAFAGTDERAVTYLQRGRRVQIRYDDGDSVRRIGSGIITKDDYQDSSSGSTITFSGPDALDELKKRSTLTNVQFAGEALNTVTDTLVALVPNWTVDNAVVNPVTARYDAVTVLKALQNVVDAVGVHLRLADELTQAEIDAGYLNKVEVGAFEDSAGVIALNPEAVTPGMLGNDDIAFIDSISITGDVDALATRLYVLGAGQNIDSSLTLEKCTRSIANGDPYDVGVEVRNGRSHYYIENTAATTEYGLIEKWVNFREIAPLSTSENDEINAANALYDKAAPALTRMSQPQIVYRLDLRKVKKPILPGNTIHLRYEDPIKRVGELSGVQAPREIDADFFVLSVTDTYTDGAHTVSLEISNIDQRPKSLAQQIFTSIEELKVYASQIQPSIVPYPYSETISIDAAGSADEQSATVGFPLQNFVYRVDRVVMRVRTERFESTSKGAASGGGNVSLSIPAHKHKIFSGLSSVSITPMNRGGSMALGDGSLTSVALWSTAPEGSDLWTLEAGGAATVSLPNHTHASDYGIYRDTAYPGQLTIRVNGTQIAVNVGTDSAQYDQEFDITAQVLARAGGFRGVHEVAITAGSGRGRVIVNFDASIYMLPFQYG